jgi:quinol monooxygenase YgiN
MNYNIIIYLIQVRVKTIRSLSERKIKMIAEPVLVFASFYPEPGMEEKVEGVLKEMVGPTRAEPGNEIYDLYQNKTPEGEAVSYHLFEKYRDQKALEDHRETDHYKNYRATIADYLSDPIGVVVLNGIDSLA